MNLQRIQFKNIDLDDVFFDSLKSDYSGFSKWFVRKANQHAYVFFNDFNTIDGFLYLKTEDEAMLDVVPVLPSKFRLKIGTFKINSHGTRLGERFIKKAIDHAIYRNVDEIYVTIFPTHRTLADSFMKYGFNHVADKNGEMVLVKSMSTFTNDVTKDYPLVNNKSRKYLLAIHPKLHSSLLPDSILKNEDPNSIVRDISHTNSIHKIYLTNMNGVKYLKCGDTLLIYRTTDIPRRAYYRAVITSVCVVEEVKVISDFATVEDFLNYALSYSIFTEQELRYFYDTKKYPNIIKFTYNIALNKRPNRAYLLDTLGMSEDNYWGFFELNKNEFDSILKYGEINESLIIN